ncbi:hypothetical protein OG226_42255 [Streptomyces sp. NBC_01261]|uniref:DUF7134 domain-containing protein n=1 Tax=Streptomyces sp. NBC_01261 TaxID=2903802 RepID=UPI002E30D1DD|nr:hypothetical protein [Streptomyces sp. NBC_01261]
MTVAEEAPARPVPDDRPFPARLRRAVGSLLRPGGQLPRPTGQQRLVDAALALVLTFVSVQYAWGDGYDEAHRHRMTGLVILVILVFLASASLAWRRRYPLAVLLLVTVATALTPDDVARPAAARARISS